MIRKLLLIGAAMLLASFTAHAALPAQLKAAADVLQEVTKAKVRPFATRDFGRERFGGAVSVLVPEAKAQALLVAVRKKLPPGFVAFIGTTHSLAEPPAVGVEVVAAPGNDPLDILDIARTDAVNYGMATKDLKEKLRQWQASYGIDIWQAETDTLQLRLGKLPANIKAFAREVYKFCPDTVDQGVGTLPALEKAIREQQGLLLWWD